VEKVAHYVDIKMAEVQEAKPSRPLHQIAILAALNICDELFQQKKHGNVEIVQFKERLELLNEKLELGMNPKME